MLNHKRYLGFALSLSAALSLASCGDDDSGQKTKPRGGNDDPTQAECYTTADCNDLYPGGVKPA